MTSRAIVTCDATVLRQEEYSRLCRKIVLSVPRRMEARAGQFCHVLTDTVSQPLLRRPFSFWDLRAAGAATEVDLLYTVVGTGTEVLSRRRPGECVGYLGPLGVGFTRSESTTYLFVAGGVGIVPFYLFAKQLAAEGNHPRMVLLFGGRTAEMLYAIDDFPAVGVEAHAATEDGSRGRKGLVTGLLEDWLPRVDRRTVTLYTCGPDPMMAAVVRICRRESIRAQVCMERRMGCALGACGACVVKVKEGEADWRYSRICLEGPAYDADRWVLE